MLGGRWLSHWLAVASGGEPLAAPTGPSPWGLRFSLRGLALPLHPYITALSTYLLTTSRVMADETNEMVSHDHNRVKLLVSW